MKNTIAIGIDQSYKNTGISVFRNGEMLKIKSLNLSDYYTSNSLKRLDLQNILFTFTTNIIKKYPDDKIICIIERIRLRSEGFINIDYIKSIGALNSIIVDVCFTKNIPVYSVDTRCWKSQVIGTSKPKSNKFGVPDEKWPTVEWCIRNGWEKYILNIVKSKRKNKGTFIRNGIKYEYNNDAADSAGIAMFYFKGDHSKLKEEK
jgi:hypothetical protein